MPRNILMKLTLLAAALAPPPAGALGADAPSAVTAAVLLELPDAGPELAALGAQIEARLLGERDGFRWVEREKVAAALQEQALTEALAPRELERRRRLGSVLRADLLVIVRPVPSKVRAVEVVVCETRRGLRLARERLLPSEKEADRLDRVAAVVRAAMARAAAASAPESHEVVAVYPFTSRNLTHDFDHLKDAYAALVEQSLADLPQVVLVELSEARAIAEEIKLAGGEAVRRRLPLFVEGEFAHKGHGPDAPVSLRVAVKRGPAVVAAWDEAEVPPGQASARLTREVLAAVAKVSGGADVKPDPKTEARELARRAGVSFRLGFWDEAERLAEAGLLLDDDQPELHRDAAIAGKHHLRHLQEAAGVAAADFWKAHLPALRRVLAHQEGYLKRRPITMNGNDFAIGLASVGPEVIAAEGRQQYVRMMKLRYEAGRKDGLYFYFTHHYQGEPPEAAAAVLEFKLAVAEYWQEHMGVSRLIHELANRRPEKADPKMIDVIERLEKSANPICRATAAEMRSRLAAGLAVTTDPKATQYVPPPRPPIVPGVRAEVRRFHLGIGRLVGWINAGKGVDALWTSSGNANVGSLFLMRKPGKCEPVCDIVAPVTQAGACFDGRYVWAAAANADRAEIVVVDPATGKQWKQSPPGMPPTPLMQFVPAELSPGRIVAVGVFGTWSNERTWVGTFDFSPEQGIRFRLVHEAADVPEKAARPDWSQPAWSFLPRRGHTLVGRDANGATRAAAVFDRAVPAVIPDGEPWRFELLRDWNPGRAGEGMKEGQVHDGALYCSIMVNRDVLRPDRIVRVSLPGPTVALVNEAAPPGQLFFHRGVPHKFTRSSGMELYRAATIDRPFERIALDYPAQNFLIQWPKFAESQHHGTVIYDDGNAGEIRFTEE